MSVVMSSISAAQSIAIAQCFNHEGLCQVHNVSFVPRTFVVETLYYCNLYIRVVFVEFLDSEECVYMVSVMV